MAVYSYHFNIKNLLDDFFKDIVTVKSHNYRMYSIISMIINTYKTEHHDEIQYIGRFCMHYSEDGDQPALDSHIMLRAILNLRIGLFTLLDNFSLVNQLNENNQYPFKLRFKSLYEEHLVIEVERD